VAVADTATADAKFLRNLKKQNWANSIRIGLFSRQNCNYLLRFDN